MKKALLLLIIMMALAKPPAVSAATLSFAPKSIFLTEGDQKAVTVSLGLAGESILGVDLVVRFDPALIKIIDFRGLSVFDFQSGEIIDNDKGIARYSLSETYGSFVKTSGNIAEFVVEGIKETTGTYITLEYTTGQTNDTNVVAAHGQDVLTGVGILTVTTKKKDLTGAVAEDNSPAPTLSSTPAPVGMQSGSTPFPSDNPRSSAQVLKVTPVVSPEAPALAENPVAPEKVLGQGILNIPYLLRTRPHFSVAPLSLGAVLIGLGFLALGQGVKLSFALSWSHTFETIGPFS